MPIHNVRQLSSDSSNHIYTIPNMITATRIASSPFLALAIVNDMKTTALFGCVAFAFTDWLDGYLAKKLNQKTNLGAILDPLADKCMVTALVAGLSYQGLLPIALSAVIVGRDVFLMAATFAARAMTRPKGSPFFDTNKTATFVIIPSSFSKVFLAILQSCFTSIDH